MPLPRQNQGNEFGDLISQTITSEGDTFYHHYDALGSTAALTDSAGVVTDEYDFEAFGETAAENGATPNPYLWNARSGYRYDAETGLYDIRRRKYSADSGRFISEDPVHSDDQNLYRYIANQPVMRRDPSGLQEHKWLQELFDDPSTYDGPPLLPPFDDPRFNLTFEKDYSSLVHRRCMLCHGRMSGCGIDWDSMTPSDRIEVNQWLDPKAPDVVSAGNSFPLLQYIEDELLGVVAANLNPELTISREISGFVVIGAGAFLVYGIKLEGGLVPCWTEAGGLDALVNVTVTGFVKLQLGGSIYQKQPRGLPKPPKKPHNTKKLSKKRLEQWKRDRKRHAEQSEEFKTQQEAFDKYCRFQERDPERKGKVEVAPIGDCPDNRFSLGFGLFAKFACGIWVVSYEASTGCKWQWDCSLADGCHAQKPQPKCYLKHSFEPGKVELKFEAGAEVFGEYHLLVFS